MRTSFAALVEIAFLGAGFLEAGQVREPQSRPPAEPAQNSAPSNPAAKVPASVSTARVIDADPSNYRELLRTLTAGDTLNLAPGVYSGLPITRLNGTPDAWISITGPDSGPGATIAARPRREILENADSSDESERSDAIQIVDSSYVAIEHLRIDSRGIPGAFGIAAHGKERNLVHDIRVEGNTFVGQNGNQGTDGISTKTPTWGWIIRNNRILGAGTGLYLGDSDGNQPFVGGIIENNLVKDSIGYDMEIKFQVSIPSIPGMPTAPTSTIIRNNVFIKNDQPSPGGDRPNVLVGGFPLSGAGALNMYEIYGNLFFHNHREALFQASGRVSLHDNIFVDGPYSYPAIVLKNHDRPLQAAYVYNNTIYTPGRGIFFGSRALIEDAVVANLIFALTPIGGQIIHAADNVAEPEDKAPLYLTAPSYDLGSMDFYPLPGKCQGAAIDLSQFQNDGDYTLDFNGTPKALTKRAVVFRGAYAGDAANPGWRLKDAIKPSSAAASNPAATLVWMSPAALPAGGAKQVKLIGANFDKQATVAVSGQGVTVSKVTVSKPSEITATFTVAASAAGEHEVTVNASSGVSNGVKFRVGSGRPAASGHPAASAHAATRPAH